MEDAAPVLDVAHLANLRGMGAGDSSGKLAAMFRHFLASVPPQLALMRASLASGELGVLLREAHALAGSSAMYGMPRLRQCCQALEAQLRHPPSGELGGPLGAVERAFEEARPLLVSELSLDVDSRG